MRVLAVSVGRPRTIEWKGKPVETGIFKSPVEGPVRLGEVNLEGDGQGDRVNHGGRAKAVYAYPVEHYPFWRDFLDDPDLPFGGLGENLTIEGLDEETACIGDVLRIGSAELLVTQPREPCFKLAWLRGREEIVRTFLRSGRSGFYLGMHQIGEISAGDRIEIVHHDPLRVPVADINRAHRGEPLEAVALRRAMEVEALPDYWRAKVRRPLHRQA